MNTNKPDLQRIGIRELRAHTAGIVRSVRDNHCGYIITLRGHPAALIVPVEEVRHGQSAGTSAWDELVALGERISLGWQIEQPSAELLSYYRG